MKSNSKTLGDIIKAVDERNSDEKTKEVLGISINKEFMPSVANIIGTDLSKYKLLRKSRFAFNSMHTGRDERLPIALFKRDDIAIVSPAYFMFEIKSKDEVDEDYLMIWFQRPEFDHICWYMTDASVRGGLSWDDFCRITIELPSIEEQRKIVHDYKVVSDRIELLTKINEKSHLICEAIYEEMCSIGEEKCLGDIVNEVESGGRPSGGAVNEGIPSIGAEKIERFGVYNFEKECYIPLDYFNNMKRGIVKSKDVLLYKDGAYTGKVSMAFDGFPYKQCAVNEHVFILRTNSSKYQAFLYFVLNNHDVMTSIHNLAASKAAQPGLNQSELLGTKIILPNESILNAFEIRANPFIKSIKNNAEEIKILHEVKNNIILSISKEVA